MSPVYFLTSKKKQMKVLIFFLAAFFMGFFFLGRGLKAAEDSQAKKNPSPIVDLDSAVALLENTGTNQGAGGFNSNPAQPAPSLPQVIPQTNTATNTAQTPGELLPPPSAAAPVPQAVQNLPVRKTTVPATGNLPLPLTTTVSGNASALPVLKNKARADEDEKIFKFIDHLKDAEVAIIYEDRENIFGRWVGDRFFFPGLGEAGEVRMIPIQIKDGSQVAIKIKPITDGALQLRFREVPVGGKFHFGLGFDESAAASDVAYAYVKVLIGQKELKRYRISNKDGWKNEILDLGVASFLSQSLTITFVISGDIPAASAFNFIPELEKIS